MADHYKANVRDLLFTVLEWSGTRERLGSPPYEDLDEDAVRDLLAAAVKLAEGPLAETFATAENEPIVFNPATGQVRIPPALRASYEVLRAAEFWRLDTIPELGGQPAPRTVALAINELLLGANPPVHMALSGPVFAGVVYRTGNPAQRRLAQLIIERGWGSTMVLTEADAGSDVGAIRTRATAQPDGSWHLEGVKRFITNGEHDLAENIVHLVLARPAGAGPGTKGLSLFLAPKFHIDPETGVLGERNGVVATGLEHKMGLVGSATCELSFGGHEDRPAVGWLLGDVHAGIVQMFQVIAHTRLSVATKALATLSTGYLNTLDFARIRVQGNDIADTGNPGSQRVAIVEHPEVRKTLMLAKCYSEGLRALLVYTAGLQDAVVAAEPASEAQAHVQARLQLLLPVVKGACSERAYEHLGQLLEVFGGSGYLRDYPLEQYVRDTRIDAIYEGTTAIQGQDLFLRRIARDGGQTFGDLCDEIESFLPELTEPELLDPAAALRVAVADIRAIVAEMVRRHDAGRAGRPREARRAGQTTTLLLLTAADLLVGYLLASQASLSLRALAAGGPSAADTAFYQGKVAAARYFARTVLPEFAGRRRVVDATGTELMALHPDVL